MPSRGKAVSKIKHSAIDALSASVEHLPALVKSRPEEASGIQVIDRLYPRLQFLKEERNYNYSDLSDFFFSWLRLVLGKKYPDKFGAHHTPKSVEVVANKGLEPEDPDGFYQRLLTECWREAHRILKPGGILAFTFHHSEDEPWVAVLESLFDAGYYLEATYPIRSDETKGDGEFGSKTIEYDIIHVCRKRTEEPKPVSWGRPPTYR